MNYKMIGRFTAQTLFVEMLFMLPALVISLFHREFSAVAGFLYTIAALVLVTGILWLPCRKAPKAMGAREGLACVSISWIVMSLLGCLPFVFSGAIPRYVDALFEIVSGFTTTGSSILARPEDLPKGILYWRSFSHWLGGMGVLVFLLALSPGDGKGSGFTMHLLRAESPGPDVGKLVPKMRKTATILYVIYIALTVLNILFLLAGGMPLLDAVCTAFGTAGTGGFGTRSDSLAGFSPYLQYVTAIFMLLFGINFSCYHLLLLKQLRSIFKDEELRLYLLIVAASILMIVLNLGCTYATFEETFRHALFQVSSIITTTGYATTDFDLWPSFSKTILLGLMVIGACAGSTGGGIKVARLLLIFKSLRRNIRQVLHPKKVQVVRSNGQVVDEQILTNTNAYLAAYVIIFVVSILLVSLDNFSPTTNITAVLACFNNIGPGLEAVGPTCNFAGFSDFSKIILSLDMLAGRLEIFPVLVLLSRSTWRHR
ncbi:MAG: TrkH family potassium uptake protein [Oscillospiraceae bacterium]|nr:TrkH family potassium uptake protein [Oscillospiraceae bacterium]